MADQMWRVEHGDCLDVMRGMADASVDAVVTDPPYFRVKAEWWDRQWDTSAGFLKWIDTLAVEWARILKPNGSLYCFASPQMSARVEVTIGARLNVLNRITWDKTGGGGFHKTAEKAALRSFFPASESIIFAERHGADSMALGDSGYAAKCETLRGFVFEPLRAYLDGERRRAGVSMGAVQAATKTQMSGHWFGRSQWALPTAPHYAALRALFNEGGGEYLRREYEDLRREYEDLRRPFSVTAAVPFTDVWSFAPVQHYRGKHPCEKPADLLRHIIRASTLPGAVVFDPFTGSGATGAVAVEEGRSFIGAEIDAKWIDGARDRIGAAAASVSNVVRIDTARRSKVPQPVAAQLPMFGVAHG